MRIPSELLISLEAAYTKAQLEKGLSKLITTFYKEHRKFCEENGIEQKTIDFFVSPRKEPINKNNMVANLAPVFLNKTVFDRFRIPCPIVYKLYYMNPFGPTDLQRYLRKKF